jgi:hypothetical protein
MKFTPVEPPRGFTVGAGIRLNDCGRIRLDADDQVTFTTEAGGEYDVVRKEWGFYATPSLNGRLPRFGLRPVLIKSRSSRFHILLVERGQEPAFEEYLKKAELTVVTWLDDDQHLADLERLARRD